MTDADLRARIDEEIDRYGWCDRSALARYHRGDIEKAVGRALVPASEIEHVRNRYEDYWERGEIRALYVLEPVWYGPHWRQKWYLLRDLVAPTRRVRALARAQRRARRVCAICGARIPKYQWLHLHDDEFETLIGERHFTIPPWERRPGRYWERLRAGPMAEMLSAYRAEMDRSGGGICSARCEATRFSRWYGHRERGLTLWWKQRERSYWEAKWIRNAKTELRKVRTYLKPAASG